MSDLTGQAWNEFTLDTQANDQISANFKLYELTKSETAERNLITNDFTENTHLQSAVYLCRNVLQVVRDEFGKFSPNSVYRSQELERALKRKPDGWLSRSQHTRGQACDIEIPGLSTMELSEWVKQSLTFDQLICECYNPAKGPNSGWVHVSLLPPGMGENRGNVLSYIFDTNTQKYAYVNGLQESV